MLRGSFVCFYLVFSRHRLASSPPSRFEPTALIAWLAAAFCPPCISTPLPLCLALDRPLLRRAGSLQRAQGPHGSLACNPHQCLMSLARVSSVPTGQTGPFSLPLSFFLEINGLESNSRIETRLNFANPEPVRSNKNPSCAGPVRSSNTLPLSIGRDSFSRPRSPS